MPGAQRDLGRRPMELHLYGQALAVWWIVGGGAVAKLAVSVLPPAPEAAVTLARAARALAGSGDPVATWQRCLQ